MFGRVIAGMQYVDAIERGEPPANPTRDRPRLDRRRQPAAVQPAPRAAPAPVAAPQPADRRRPSSTLHRRRRASAAQRAAARCASTSSISTCRPSGSRCAPRARAMRRGCWCSTATGPRDRERARPARRCCARATCWCSTTPASSPRSSRDGAARRGSARRCTSAIDLRRWQAFVRNAKRLRDGDTIDFGAGVTRDRRGRGTPTAASRSTSPATSRSSCCSNAPGAMPLPPYIAAQAPDRRARRRRLPDDVRARGRRGRRAHRRAALHARADRRARRGGDRPRDADAPCRRGHLPAGQGRRHRPTTRCTPNGAGSTPRPPTGSTPSRAAGGRVIAVGTTSLRLLESAAGEDGTIRPFEGDTAIFITPGLPLPRRSTG